MSQIISFRFAIVLGLLAIVMAPAVAELLHDLKTGNAAQTVLLWDFLDYTVFNFGLFFMAVYVRGNINRVAVYAFGLIVPLQYIVFDVLYAYIYESTWTVNLIYPVMSYVGLVSWRYRTFIFRRIIKAVALITTTALSVLAAIALAFRMVLLMFTTSPTSAYRKSVETAGLIKDYLAANHSKTTAFRDTIPLGDTNLSLAMNRFLVWSIIIDFIYVGMCYTMMVVYDRPFGSYLSDFVAENDVFNPANFHSLAYILLQAFYITAFVFLTIKDQDKPDSVGLGKTMMWDKDLEQSVSSTANIARKAYMLGMQAGLIVSIYGILTDSLQASFYGLFILISCYYVALIDRK